MILVQKLKYFGSLLWGRIGQETYFRDIPDRKESFLDYKNKLEKKSKNSNFSKGSSFWFCSKSGNIS